MNQFVEKALKHLTGKSDIDYVSIQELERIANEYPYFPVAQVLLSKKLKIAESEAFLPQVQKTALYFTNAHWLHYQLLHGTPTLKLEEQRNKEEQIETIDEGAVSPPETSGFVVTETGNIRFSKEEISAASLLAKQTLENKPEETSTVDEDVEDESKPSTVSNTSSDLATTEDIGEDAPALEDQVEEVSKEEKSIEETTPPEIVLTEELIENEEEEHTLRDAQPQRVEDSNYRTTDGNPEDIAEQRQDKNDSGDDGFSTPLGLAEIDHPTISSNFQGSEEALPESTIGPVTENSNESEVPSSPRPVEENMDIPIEANYYLPDNFTQQPPAAKDVHNMDNPLISQNTTLEAEEKTPAIEIEQREEYVLSNLSEKINELDNPVEDIERIDLGDPLASPLDTNTQQPGEAGEYVLSNLSDKIASLDNPAEDIDKIDLGEPAPIETGTAEQPAPDPFHPEQEEILEELDQEQADKEVSKDTPPTEQEHSVEDIRGPETAANSKQEGPDILPAINFADKASANESRAGDALIPIEPYHTIDYFASQGIKLTLEKDPQDNLGKKLRRFTDWLKHMKRIGPEDALQPAEEAQVDTKIQVIANTSNKPGDIVTEAMAEVLEKQGKTDQAIEVYNKLSFLHPDKTPYFAHKIQKLKGF